MPRLTQMMVVPPLHLPERAGIEELRAELWRFDLSSLLACLSTLGYRWDELRFASHASVESPRRLVHDIELYDDPRRVRIVLNIGLLSAQSPLPGYLFKELDSGRIDSGVFSDFIGFFDHVILSRLVLATQPELDRQLFCDVQQARREDMQLLNLRSAATLHWLFQQIFPELLVQVEPIRKRRRVRSDGVRLGDAVLGGEATLGARATAMGPGKRVTLVGDEEDAASGRTWPLEARRRLDTFALPLLRPFGVALEVFLVLREQQSWARLSDGCHLGYDQLRGGKQERRVALYDTNDEAQP
jgi:predicted component of type VI protein secretion system